MSFIPMRVSVGTTSSVTGTTGTGAAGRVAYWQDATTLTSSASFTFNGTTLALPDGAAATPAYGFVDDATTGFYRRGAGSIGIASGGVAIGQLGLDVSFTAPTANPLILKALTANSNGLRFYANTATDVATIVNGYNAALELGANNTVFQTISSAGKVSIGADGGSQTHNIQGDGVSLRRSGSTVTFDISNSSNDGGITINGDTGVSAGACLQVFGGSHASNPSYTLFRNANVQTGSILNTGVWSIGPNAGGVTHRFNTNTQTTVGAAGAASALPANPTGYWLLNINGTTRAIPYYANA